MIRNILLSLAVVSACFVAQAPSDPEGYSVHGIHDILPGERLETINLIHMIQELYREGAACDRLGEPVQTYFSNLYKGFSVMFSDILSSEAYQAFAAERHKNILVSMLLDGEPFDSVIAIVNYANHLVLFNLKNELPGSFVPFCKTREELGHMADAVNAPLGSSLAEIMRARE